MLRNNSRMRLAISLIKACGLVLLFAGFSLFTDQRRILISRLIGAGSETLSNLPHPFLYYVALGLAIAGLIMIFVSFIGWWTTCLSNYCLLATYFTVLLMLLLVVFTFCCLATILPRCIGLIVDDSIFVKALQSSYGVPGREQLTASIDLIQTNFKCCAINSNLNYDMSLWKLQNFGQQDWVVPQTCCILSNDNEELSYLDPKPQNLTLCQSLLKNEYNRARYTENCIEHISVWYKMHLNLLLLAAIVVAVVLFLSLLSVIFSCARRNSNRKTKQIVYRSRGTTMQASIIDKPPNAYSCR